MKKVNLCCCIATLALLFCSACKQNSIEIQDATENSAEMTEIAVRISELKKAGLLDSLLSSDRAVTDDDNSEAICEFINNTDEVLLEIKNSENGDEKLAVIDALFTQSDINGFASAFSAINSEKAEDFLDYVNLNLINSDETDVSRCASGFDKLKLSYLIDVPATSRGAYASDLEWSTIYWYTGFCASTIAGFYLASYGCFWLKVAGAIAASAGSISMVYQLINWNSCSDLGAFISSLANKDSVSATKILNSESGAKILTITSETVATVAACYFTPLGKTIVKTVVHYMNIILGKIIAVLPSGINFVINGIPIKLIVL
jgi:hypothetical protein